MKSSITAKFILSYAAIIFMMAGISMSFISLFSDGYIMAESKKQLEGYADKLVTFVVSHDIQSTIGLKQTLTDLAENNYALAVYNGDGECEVSVNRNSLSITEEEFDREVQPKLQNDGADILRHNKNNYALYIRNLYTMESEDPVLTLVLYMQVDRYGLDSTLFTLYLMAIMVAAVFAVCFALIFSSTLTLNIKKLKIRANMLAKRNFSCTIKVDSDDEVGELADAIDAMAKNIEEYDLSQKIFLQNASHELRTPLMSIRGYTEGLKDGVFENTDEMYGEILEQTTRLEKIIEDIMYLSKLETVKDFSKNDEVSTLQIIEESVDRVNGIALSNNISIVMGDLSIVNILCDMDNLCVALTNIISNCLRFAKTTVAVSVRPVTKGVCFTVSDDGPGINEEDLGHIFDRFYKGKKGKHGLGLAIAKAVVTAHGGAIHAHNKKGGGTGAVFEIFIPAK